MSNLVFPTEQIDAVHRELERTSAGPCVGLIPRRFKLIPSSDPNVPFQTLCPYENPEAGRFALFDEHELVQQMHFANDRGRKIDDECQIVRVVDARSADLRAQLAASEAEAAVVREELERAAREHASIVARLAWAERRLTMERRRRIEAVRETMHANAKLADRQRKAYRLGVSRVNLASRFP